MAKPCTHRRQNSPPESLAAALGAIATADTAAFSAMWNDAFGRPLPKALNRRVAQACLNYRVQEQHLGGLSRDAMRDLAELTPDALTSAPRLGRIRRYKPGTRLVRTWRGRTYVVTIAAPGYLYEGRSYRSLSLIAREITGTPWSGPVFFGLKIKPVAGTNT